MSEDNRPRLAGYAASALSHYCAETRDGASYGDEGSDDMETAMVDLLADLQHLADRAGLDWDLITETAEGHYDIEVMQATEEEE